MAAPPTDDLIFKYTAVDRTGKQVRDMVRARDARAAARALVAEGLTPITVQETRAKAMGGGTSRDLNFSERVLVLRQLALMVEAGVGLLEAMETVTPGVRALKGRLKLEAATNALKRGDNFATALEQHATGFPFYVYAMVRVGEATGKLAEVLSEAAEQMAFEDRLRRDVIGALIYPGILITVGFLVVTILLVAVMPRFRAILTPDVKIPLVSQVMFALSDAVTQHFGLFALGFGGVVAALAAAFTNRQMRVAIGSGARNMVLIGGIMRAREITAWSRLLSFSLTSGVNLLEAASLARRGAPEGPFRQGLDQFERDLKSGVDVADSLARHTPLTAMDLSLLRAGQKSGTLPRMFSYIAETYEATLRARLKFLTTLLGPIALILIAVMVLLVGAAIMLALLATYDQIEQV